MQNQRRYHRAQQQQTVLEEKFEDGEVELQQFTWFYYRWLLPPDNDLITLFGSVSGTKVTPQVKPGRLGQIG
ncbi:MAG: hypothetical protein WBZ20_17350 [Nitrososphaeraceae archaeon]